MAILYFFIKELISIFILIQSDEKGQVGKAAGLRRLGYVVFAALQLDVAGGGRGGRGGRGRRAAAARAHGVGGKHPFKGLASGKAVGGQAVVFLKCLDRSHAARAVYAVDAAVVVAQLFQLSLHRAHSIPLESEPHALGRGGRCDRRGRGGRSHRPQTGRV